MKQFVLRFQNNVVYQLDSELKRLSEENSHLKKQLELSDNVSVVNELEQCQQKLAESEASVKKTKTIFQTKVYWKRSRIII